MSFANIDVAGLDRLYSDGASVVDVRTDAEVMRGIIPGATHIALDQLRARFAEFDQEKPIVLYCQMGGRSAGAAQFLVSQGFRHVYNLQGGINAWAAAGRVLGSLT